MFSYAIVNSRQIITSCFYANDIYLDSLILYLSSETYIKRARKNT